MLAPILAKLIVESLQSRHAAWKVSKYGVISGPHFPIFGLNTDTYEENLRIQSEYRKIQTRNTSVFGHISLQSRHAQSSFEVSLRIFGVISVLQPFECLVHTKTRNINYELR